MSSNVSPHEGMETPVTNSHVTGNYPNGVNTPQGQTLGVNGTNGYQQRHLLVNGPMTKKIEN